MKALRSIAPGARARRSTLALATVQQYADNGTLARRFSIKAAADPTTFVITNENSGKCLDVADWSTNDGGKIQQWSCSGNVDQTYRLTKQ